MSLKALGWVAALVVGGLVYVNANSPKLSSVPTTGFDAPAEAVIPSVSVGDVGDYWRFSEDADRMTGKITSYAELVSTNSLSLGFPYAGSNYGTIVLRRSPRYGLDAMIRVQKGQILCHTDDCSILVRFDDAKPQRFSGQEPADYSSTVVFVANASRFLAQAKTAKRIRVELGIYQEGMQVLEFSTNRALGKF